MVALTGQQLDSLRFIKRYSELNGFPPTRRELASYMGWTAVSTAQKVVDALERKGVIERKRFGLVVLTLLGRSVLNERAAA